MGHVQLTGCTSPYRTDALVQLPSCTYRARPWPMTHASPAPSTPTSTWTTCGRSSPTATAWAEWMVDGADIEVDPGAHGTVVDDGVARDVRIDRVEPSSGRVAFTWWPQARPDQASTVELVVVPARTGSRLHVTETYAARHGRGRRAGLGRARRCSSWPGRRSPSRDRRRRRRPSPARRAVRRPRRPHPPGRARAARPRRPADGHRAGRPLPVDAPVRRQAPAGARRRRARHARAVRPRGPLPRHDGPPGRRRHVADRRQRRLGPPDRPPAARR